MHSVRPHSIAAAVSVAQGTLQTHLPIPGHHQALFGSLKLQRPVSDPVIRGYVGELQQCLGTHIKYAMHMLCSCRMRGDKTVARTLQRCAALQEGGCKNEFQALMGHKQATKARKHNFG